MHRFPALGTVGVVGVEDPGAAATAMAVVMAEIDECDRACSRFRDDSDLSRLNAGAGHYVVVSERLIDDIDAGLRAAELTDGIVDPTVGAPLVALGYDRDFASIATGGAGGAPFEMTFTAVPGWRAVDIDRRRCRVRVPAGVLVDLGATAKARCADLAASTAAAAAGCGVLVSLGGDLALAGSVPPGGWRIRVTDDAADSPDAPGQTVALTAGALATSSVTVRTWTRHGASVHHLVDPRTGGPASVVWRTVSVTAATCVDANIASTASIILGGAAPAWLADLGLCARLVAVDGAVTVVGGWPADGSADQPGNGPADHPGNGPAGNGSAMSPLRLGASR